MPGDASRPLDNDSIDLARIWNVLWRKKWLIVAVTALFAVASIVYTLTLTHWYRSEVLLAPAEKQVMNTGIMGQLGGLAGLAGISVGGGGSVEALAVLNSRDFTREFIEEQNLLPVLFADRWDEEKERWLEEDPELWPDVNDAVLYFNSSLRSISEDRQTGLVTLAVEWTDRELAARWASLLVVRLNDYMRTRALREAQANIEYLQAELTATSSFALQQAIGNLLEREHQKLMLARGNDEFSFRVIDSAVVPDSPSRPNRRLMVIVATLFGGVIAVFFVLARHFAESRTARDVDVEETTAE
jgi:uncharacterized protein involved in exopolysaccharide biosynthesis